MSRIQRFRPLALALLLGLGASAAQAQHYEHHENHENYAFDYSPYTGDREFDAQVAAVNGLVTSDLDGFVNDIVSIYGAPRHEVRQLVIERHYPPDYVWMAAASAQELNRPWQQVFPVFEQNRGRGWGVIAKELGIKPGSPAFHALKGDIGRRNGHWKAGKVKSGGNMRVEAAGAPSVHGNTGAGKAKGPAKAKGKAKVKAKGKQK